MFLKGNNRCHYNVLGGIGSISGFPETHMYICIIHD